MAHTIQTIKITETRRYLGYAAGDKPGFDAGDIVEAEVATNLPDGGWFAYPTRGSDVGTTLHIDADEAVVVNDGPRLPDLMGVPIYGMD